jgi:NADH:ubiquinone reductase (H+-translocating)
VHQELVIVGCGFAGFWSAVASRRAGGAGLGVALVAPQPTLVMRPRLYEARPETLAVDVRPMLDALDITYVQGFAESITSNELCIADSAISFDRLIVAAGSVMKRPPIPGAETAFSIDTQGDAVAFDRRLSELAATRQTVRIAVIGAGFSGIELALELSDRVAVHSPHTIAEVTLVDQADDVGAELGVGPRRVIVEALTDANVTCELGASVRSLTATSVVLEDRVVPVDMVVLTTGLVAAPFIREIPGERDRFGRILVDEFLRSPGAPHVFVTGDAACADVGDGHWTMMSCQHAMQLGRYAGQNAANDLLGFPLIPYRQLRYVTCLDLGRSGAVLTTGWDRQVAMNGTEAKSLKRRINTEIIYPPTSASVDDLLFASQTTP